MAPLSHPEGCDLSRSSTAASTWTLITHRSKGLKSDDQTSYQDHASNHPTTTAQLTETVLLQPRRTLPPTTFTPCKYPWHHPSSSYHQRLNSPAQRHTARDQDQIGHPAVLYKDYRKKRKREFLTSDEEGSSSSESDLESRETDTDSTLFFGSGGDYEDDSVSVQESDSEEPDNSDQYPFLRRDIVEFVYTLFVLWMAPVRYIIPPEHRLKLPKKKRAKQARMFIEETDPGDPSVMLISAFDGYYHLACPFYRCNPTRHQNCIIRHGPIRSIEDLVEHIMHHHAEPPLCKLCGRVFDSIKARNDHVRYETCDRQDEASQIPHGVTQLQRVKILKRDNPRRTEEDRWTRIYRTIFESEPTVSAYLTEGEGFKFSLLHDYWKAQGKECVRKYLTDHGHEQIQEGSGGVGGRSAEFAKLCSLVLEDLRKKVQEEVEDVRKEDVEGYT